MYKTNSTSTFNCLNLILNNKKKEKSKKKFHVSFCDFIILYIKSNTFTKLSDGIMVTHNII